MVRIARWVNVSAVALFAAGALAACDLSAVATAGAVEQPERDLQLPD